MLYHNVILDVVNAAVKCKTLEIFLILVKAGLLLYKGQKKVLKNF